MALYKYVYDMIWYDMIWYDMIPTGTPPARGVECRWGRPKTRFRTNSWLYWTCVYWCLQHMYRVTLIGVFLGHFRISLHQTRMQYSNEGPQHWNAAKFPKKTLSKCGILSPKNSCHFFRNVNSKFQAASKINKWRQAHFGHALSWISTCRG